MLKIENIIDPEKKYNDEYLKMVLRTIAPSLFEITDNICVSYGDKDDNINCAYDIDIDNNELFVTDGVVKMRQVLSINFIEVNHASYIVTKKDDNITIYLNIIEIEDIMKTLPSSLELIDRDWENIEEENDNK